MAPVDRGADERLADTPAARLRSDRDETDRARLPGLVDVHGHVPRRRPLLVWDEHRFRPTVAAAADPQVVEVVAPLPRKPRICVEARVAVAHTRDRPQRLDIFFAVLTHGRTLGRGRPVQLDANIHQLKAGLLRSTTLVDV